ncbi:CaiB/BaiF CoA transferase family protein [uncultured Sphingomonas sp.]|uniref:CaiB/BaiF CoA transferase family protein n=1 Tax=uncultured Sphingomonas sp. TaxID=158754 RepID=UPI0035CBBFD2
MLKVLQGIRVVEQGTFITGPCAAMMLADLGADVIKLESPGGGDPYRSFRGGYYSAHFQAYNRNKRALSLDLKTDADREVLYDLVGSADVYIQNFRPGAADRMGVGPDALRPRNPGLVYCSISGFGQSGPYAARPSYDSVTQALSGFLGVAIDPEAPRLLGPAMADAITGLYAAMGIMGALIERGRTGRGRLLEVSMLEAMMHFAVEPFTGYFALGEVPTALDRPRLAQAFIVRTRNNRLIGLHLSSIEKFWTNLLEAIEAPDLAADDRFATRQGRIDHYPALLAALNAVFSDRDRAAWLVRLEQFDVPFAPVNTVDEAAMDPQAAHLGMVVPVEERLEGARQAIRAAFSYDGVRDASVLAAPQLNQHGETIRAALRDDPDCWPFATAASPYPTPIEKALA